MKLRTLELFISDKASYHEVERRREIILLSDSRSEKFCSVFLRFQSFLLFDISNIFQNSSSSNVCRSKATKDITMHVVLQRTRQLL